jgi:hypothetical protein
MVEAGRNPRTDWHSNDVYKGIWQNVLEAMLRSTLPQGQDDGLSNAHGYSKQLRPKPFDPKLTK